jgi:thymidylate synthase (FAD)
MLVKLLRQTSDPEKTCALAGRLCYSSRSIDELSEKLTPAAIKDLLQRVISSEHLSVLEHASFTFGIEGVSRALLAQLSRHRIASFSVQSQRYVKLRDKLKYVLPPEIKKRQDLAREFVNAVEFTKNLYDKLLSEGIAAEDARYVLPQAATTKIICTMNARELRHFFALRCCNRAQWEIRDMSCRMLALVRKAAPLLFANAGPDCVRGNCREAEPCGRPWQKIICRNSKFPSKK